MFVWLCSTNCGQNVYSQSSPLFLTEMYLTVLVTAMWLRNKVFCFLLTWKDEVYYSNLNRVQDPLWEVRLLSIRCRSHEILLNLWPHEETACGEGQVLFRDILVQSSSLFSSNQYTGPAESGQSWDLAPRGCAAALGGAHPPAFPYYKEKSK